MKILVTPTHTNLNSKNTELTTLINLIKVKLQNANRAEVIQSMGYHSIKKGLVTLEKFLECTDTFTGLKSGHYDFNFSSKEFLEKISTVLEIDSKLYQEEIDNFVRLDKEHDKIKGCYIFVNTNFHRTTQPIFALAFMEGHRLLSPAKKSLIFKTDKQIFKSISKMVRKHYLANEGNLTMWGKIDNYIYHHFDGKKYVFDSDGSLLEDANEISESRAILSLK